MENVTLNAGCGSDGYGDIRVDIQRYRNELPNRPKTTANVLASIEALPFKPKIFFETRCFHVLEHVSYPQKAYKEIVKVTSGRIHIKVPIWHFYSFLIEALGLIRNVKGFRLQLKCVLWWKKRYSEHKWYIRFHGAKTLKRFLIIPSEYELTREV